MFGNMQVCVYNLPRVCAAPHGTQQPRWCCCCSTAVRHRVPCCLSSCPAVYGGPDAWWDALQQHRRQQRLVSVSEEASAEEEGTPQAHEHGLLLQHIPQKPSCHAASLCPHRAPVNMPALAWQQQQAMVMQQQMAMQQQQQQAMQMQAMRMHAMQQQQQQQMRPPPQAHTSVQQQPPQQQQQQQPPQLQLQLPGGNKQYNFQGARKRPAPTDSSNSGRPLSNKAAKRAAASAPLVPLTGPVAVRPAANAEEAAEIEAWKAERRKHWPSATNTAKKVSSSSSSTCYSLLLRLACQQQPGSQEQVAEAWAVISML